MYVCPHRVLPSFAAVTARLFQRRREGWPIRLCDWRTVYDAGNAQELNCPLIRKYSNPRNEKNWKNSASLIQIDPMMATMRNSKNTIAREKKSRKEKADGTATLILTQGRGPSRRNPKDPSEGLGFGFRTNTDPRPQHGWVSSLGWPCEAGGRRARFFGPFGNLGPAGRPARLGLFLPIRLASNTNDGADVWDMK